MELVDIYDAQGRPTGKVQDREAPLAAGEYLLAVGVWIVDGEGNILLTQRSPEKRWAPGKWENTAGHAQAGEDCPAAMAREIREETGIEVIIDPTFREIVSYSPKKDTQKDVIYFLARAKTFDYVPQEEEIAQIRWVELGRVHEVLSYDNDKQLVNKAKPLLTGR